MMISSGLGVTVPPTAHAVRVVRAVANAVAANESLAYDTLGDIDLAIDEGCAALLELDSAQAIHCSIETAEDGIHFDIGVDRSAAAAYPQWPDPGWSGSLGALVLGAVASDVVFLLRGQRPSITFRVGQS